MNRENERTLDRLAREILMVDQAGNSLIPEYERIIERGLPNPLPPTAERRDVLIVGAGIAGLLTGQILKKAGYNVTILEANDNRVGGRVKTFHTRAGGDAPFKDPNQYAEAGAMRIPTTHPLVNKLIDVMGLKGKLQPFYNADVAKQNPDPKNPINRTWLNTNGIRTRRTAYNNSELPARTTGFPIPPEHEQSTADKLLTQALAEPNSWIAADPKLPVKEQIEKQLEGWKKVIRHFDQFSMLGYLRNYYTALGVPAEDQENLIAYMGTLQNLTSRLFLSFIHSFVDTFYIKPGADYVELAGGNWQLPEAFVEGLSENLVMEARAIEIQWSDPKTGATGPKATHRGRPGVYVRTINEPVNKRGETGLLRMEREFTADYLVIAIPFSALRFVTVTPEFSFPKRRAIIELHYDSATKVLLEFSERFWEWGEDEWAARLPGEYKGHDSIGGGSITDTPNRFIYYPSHRVKDGKGGVILASYTWADDASRWDSIPKEDRYNFALKGLTEIYGKGIKRYFTGYGKTESWMENYYAFGEAAVFTPGQLTTLHPHIAETEGLVHFAGEHTSLKHAWIEGAIESAIRVAIEVGQRDNGHKENR